MSPERPINNEILRNTKISFDVDGVLANSGIPVCEEFNKIFGTDRKPHELDHWDSIKFWAIEKGLSDGEAELLLKRLWYTPELLFKAPPIEGAVMLMDRLYSEGIKPQIITSRELRSGEMTREWFKKYFPFVDQNTLNLCPSNVREERKAFKANTILKHGIGMHFEDSIEDIEKILEVSSSVQILMVPHRYNYKVKPMERVIEYDEKEVDLGKSPTLYPIYKKIFVNG
jgi:5'(3')-deoxyribonucleotidase